jgi:hypothetical protein
LVAVPVFGQDEVHAINSSNPGIRDIALEKTSHSYRWPQLQLATYGYFGDMYGHNFDRQGFTSSYVFLAKIVSFNPKQVLALPRLADRAEVKHRSLPKERSDVPGALRHKDHPTKTRLERACAFVIDFAEHVKRPFRISGP